MEIFFFFACKQHGSIGISTFAFCSGLTSVTIGKGTTKIGEDVFEFCVNLSNLVINNSVTEIGNYAIADCGKLFSIAFQGTISEWQAIKKGTDWRYNSAIESVVCTDGTLTGNDIG